MPLRISLLILCLTIFFLLPSGEVTSSDIYKYTDENGTVHIVDSPEKIPSALEDEAEKTEVSSGTKKRTDNYKDLFSEDIEKSRALEEEEKKKKEEKLNEWNEKKRKLESELSEIEDKIKSAEAFKLRTVSSYSRKNYTNSDRQSAQKQLDAANESYERAKEKWEEFKESARTDAPYDWWRENFY